MVASEGREPRRSRRIQVLVGARMPGSTVLVGPATLDPAESRGDEEEWPGGLGQTGSLAKRMLGAFSLPAGDVHVVDPVREDVLQLGASLVSSPADAGDDIGTPELDLVGPVHVLDAEPRAFR